MNVTFRLMWQTRTANLEGELRGTVVNDTHKQFLLDDLSVRGFRAEEVDALDTVLKDADPFLRIYRLASTDVKVRLCALLEGMPPEAFSWFVLATLPSAMLQGANAQIWPDGIGGFTQASKDAITEMRAAAEAYRPGTR